MSRHAFIAVFFLLACAPGSSPEATVAGKTVYRGMGVEGAVVEVWHLEAGRWARAGTARSGYHGSFAARLRPGEYRLVARADLASGNGSVPLRGVLERLKVAPGKRRIDRLVIGLVRESTPGG